MDCTVMNMMMKLVRDILVLVTMTTLMMIIREYKR